MTGVMVVHGSPTHNERPRPKGELSGADPPIAHASSTQHMETSAKGKREREEQTEQNTHLERVLVEGEHQHDQNQHHAHAQFRDGLHRAALHLVRRAVAGHVVYLWSK